MIKKLIALLFVILIPFSLIACEDEITQTKKNNNKKDNYISKQEVEQQIYYTVTYQTNGGSKISSEQYLKDGFLTKAPATTKENYIFEGWFLDETLTTAAIFPIKITNDINLYAKWLKIKDITQIENCKIKLDSDYSSAVTCSLTPTGFDFDALNLKNYKIKITVNYNVRYKKDYNVLLDIGYFGSPKYEASLYNSQTTGIFQEDLSTTTSANSRSISITEKAIDLKQKQITLVFSTNNIQNIIYFEDIYVTYECIK